MDQQPAKRRPGRPRKPDGEARRIFYQTRIRESLRQRLLVTATEHGRSLSEEIKQRLERSFRDDDVVSAVIDRFQIKGSAQ